MVRNFKILATSDHTVPRSPSRSLSQKNEASGYRYSIRWLSVFTHREETTQMKKSISLSQACDGVIRHKSAVGMSPNTGRD